MTAASCQHKYYTVGLYEFTDNVFFLIKYVDYNTFRIPYNYTLSERLIIYKYF